MAAPLQLPLFESAPPPCRRLTRGRAARQLFRAHCVPACRRNRRVCAAAASEAPAAVSGAAQHSSLRPLIHGFGGAVVAQLCTAPVVEHAPGWLSVALVEHESVPFSLTAHLCKRGAASTGGASPTPGARRGLRLVYMLAGDACASPPAEDDSFSGSPACNLRAMSLSAGDSALLDGDAVLTRASGDDVGGEFLFAAMDIHIPETSTRRQAPTGGRAHPALGSDAVHRLLCHRTPGSSKTIGGAGSRPRVRGLLEADTYQLPGQSNRVALVFDPKRDGSLAINFTLGIEVFPPGHVTPRHTHAVGYELFVILSGTGTAQCEADTWPVGPGSVVVFPPTLEHGIDVDEGGRMYCLQMMLPDDSFADFVRSGSRDEEVGGAALREEDLCALVGCDLDLSAPDADSRGRSAR
jgi:quercetin dioxygenase-like cupin family protein